MQKDTHFSLSFGVRAISGGVLGGHLLHYYSAKCVLEEGPSSSRASREARPGQARPGQARPDEPRKAQVRPGEPSLGSKWLSGARNGRLELEMSV